MKTLNPISVSLLALAAVSGAVVISQPAAAYQTAGVVHQAMPLAPAIHQALPAGAVRQAVAPGAVHQAVPPRAVHQAVAPGDVHKAVPPGAVHQAVAPGAVHQAVAPGAVHQAVAPGAVHQAVAPGAVHHAVAIAGTPTKKVEATAVSKAALQAAPDPNASVGTKSVMVMRSALESGTGANAAAAQAATVPTAQAASGNDVNWEVSPPIGPFTWVTFGHKDGVDYTKDSPGFGIGKYFNISVDLKNTPVDPSKPETKGFLPTLDLWGNQIQAGYWDGHWVVGAEQGAAVGPARIIGPGVQTPIADINYSLHPSPQPHTSEVPEIPGYDVLGYTKDGTIEQVQGVMPKTNGGITLSVDTKKINRDGSITITSDGKRPITLSSESTKYNPDGSVTYTKNGTWVIIGGPIGDSGAPAGPNRGNLTVENSGGAVTTLKNPSFMESSGKAGTSYADYEKALAEQQTIAAVSDGVATAQQVIGTAQQVVALGAYTPKNTVANKLANGNYAEATTAIFGALLPKNTEAAKIANNANVGKTLDLAGKAAGAVINGHADQAINGLPQLALAALGIAPKNTVANKLSNGNVGQAISALTPSYTLLGKAMRAPNVSHATDQVGKAGIAALAGDGGAVVDALTTILPGHTVGGKAMRGDVGAALSAVVKPYTVVGKALNTRVGGVTVSEIADHVGQAGVAVGEALIDGAEGNIPGAITSIGRAVTALTPPAHTIVGKALRGDFAAAIAATTKPYTVVGKMMNGPVGNVINHVGEAGVALLKGDPGKAYAALTPPANTIVGKAMRGDIGGALAALFGKHH